MIRRTSVLVGWTGAALVAAGLAVVPTAGAVGSDDPVAIATARLRADAEGTLRLAREADGRVRFVGTAARDEVDNPAVGRSDSVRAAARAHLDRYGAALGATRGSAFAQRSAQEAVSGVDVVRFQQTVSDVPVLGGDVVVTLGPNRELRSLSADVTPSARVVDPVLSTAEARQRALAVTTRAHRDADLTVTDLGRWVLDPQVAGLDLPGGVRTVRRLEVGDGAGIRDLVLVDDQNGAVVFRTSLIEQADRVVCDRNNVRGAETSCTSGFARAESDAATGVADVDNAFDLSGAVADFYHEIDPTIDLTALLGIDVSGVKKLASTVRFCTTDLSDPCPFPNAYWSGTQMYYGQGFAGADDVVGHEMTHGFVDQHSMLFYWGQSGAINESMADVIGEIIDHRHPSAGDSPTNWLLGEDLPGGAIRDMADPTAFSQPDRMTSNLYTADDSTYNDNAGVHTNSGVGNETAYLISQGGTFNGQTITGIDGGDATLTKTAELYVDVIEKLSSGADYAALAEQLDQSCADLLTAGTADFTAANCTAVHQAGLATELSTNPSKALHANDAATTCPAGTAKRVLLDSETDPMTKFAPVGTGWTRESTAGTTNATSGTDSWYAEDPGGATPSSAWIKTNPLRSSSSIALPAGQESFLSFENWYVFDYYNGVYYDGGTVELGVDGGIPAYGSTNGATWVNGPNHTLASGYGNTGSGQPAYSGDSHGWSVSRLDLTPSAGHTVQPQFTMRSDNSFGFIGWYVDDITIYTCDPVPSAPRAVSSGATGAASASQPLAQYVAWQAPAVNPASVTGYHVYLDGVLARTTSASTLQVIFRNLAQTRRHTMTVRAMGPDGYQSAGVSTTTLPSSVSLSITRSGAKVTLHGVLRRAGSPYGGHRVWIERKTRTGWLFVGSPPMARRPKGTYTITLTRKAAATYRVRFAGSFGVTGSFSPLRRK